MIESEKANSISEQKARIRQRYKGIDEDLLEVIPALPKSDFYEDQRKKRVGVYARVSTDDPNQTSSYELQKNHYYDLVNRHPGWKLVEIYADEGISGTSLQHRDSFLRMIEDCKAGKIDMIITKSVSRFARNVLDCIGYARSLKAMNPPIGIFFETENIFTLNDNSEMSLSFISTLAQEESHTKSEIMNASIEMRFGRGIFLTPVLLGYDHDEDGNLVINEDEAKTVRLIFFMYLYGYSTSKIATILTELKRKTKIGNTTWSSSSVLGVLQNERHCGDVLSRKTWTPNYLDHKSKKNKQNRNQYVQQNHHEAIISRDDYIAVQRLIRNSRYKHKGFLPELLVIPEGALKGYVSVNPRWAGFKADDYINASSSVITKDFEKYESHFEVNDGDFDLSDFEVVRSQFFSSANKVCITFSSNRITFSSESIKKLDSLYIEMLVQPDSFLFVIRPASKENRNAVQWASIKNERKQPRPIVGSAFLPNLYELFDWNLQYKYKIAGTKRKKGAEEILIFNLQEMEVFIPNTVLEDSDDDAEPSSPAFDENVAPLSTKNSLVAYPEEWTNTFGSKYYQQSSSAEILPFNEAVEWNTQISATTYDPVPLALTSPSEIAQGISTIINDMKQEVHND
ncbi:MAG: recombinase family protein [Candidatus Pacebacteria bacterium]|nr:recombinase family protein [Candidatus Paceibacterota bacterium]